MKVVTLVGGVGGAKLAYGLSRVLPPQDLTIIVNTADDFWHYGLRICPDLDTITYTLSGLVDPVNGWGVAGDTTAMLEALRSYGEDAWFRLGDRDLATHLLRTERLRRGESLTAITAYLTAKLGILPAILPMTDDPVATTVSTREHGVLDFQTYFVRHRWQPVVTQLQLEGIAQASLTTAGRLALEMADIILIGPSNPWLSIDPILSLPGVRELLRSRSIPRVAISPIVGGKAIKGPAAKLMAELGLEVSAGAVAQHYGDLLNGFVLDTVDAGQPVPQAQVLSCETIMNSDHDKVLLAESVLRWIQSWM
jgi:LPPG:FO 2-phospho-L-lactate transferase